ncbi:N-acetylglucosaminyl-phosphatidylinositol deacetylase, putative [Talaromyces stipitatus ATCC 10500]|uniref:N-acetylglucosaminylphosphatidylinositol deacetylase n=1 Tax=Talaromyces stipitatus (strain ATCC 10500 / CBS 375.48 / QM 6759 / NRRL 1006) TaxID=441959 RepID=B8M337_TALSN|nr:N-acetylglucosaminyl-phosphatidylinositol deacetylase, putative [Talaromyces stipitatus ATCC 10500]EED22013.1 N-acetylglucosaminyl-phosphatidylinositol deacetylase, putative [Talaromyces stipitatus ATCC 10500]
MTFNFSWIVTALLAPLVVTVFWTLSSTSSGFSSFPTLYNKRICLLIAHPDDEAMFFAPTVLALTKPELGNHVKILCLSTGNADGLGEVRRKELQQSAVHLGLRDESDVFVIDDPSRFPDSMTATWSANDISSLLASAFAPELASGRAARNDVAPKATIDVLLTFDEHGVSNHPNHRSLYHGAVAFLKTLMDGKSGYGCPVSLYTLTTTNIIRKYSGILDSFLTMFLGAFTTFGDSLVSAAKKPTAKNDGNASRLLYISSFHDWVQARTAMTDGHKSQMLWFRWGWITIGRYMFVNDLKKEKI